MEGSHGYPKEQGVHCNVVDSSRNCEKHGEIGLENKQELRKGKRRNCLFRIMLVFVPPLDS